MPGGRKCWYIVDGYRPPAEPAPEAAYEGHESVMILNANDRDAHVRIDIYFEDRDPAENIPLTVPAKRIRAFRTSDNGVLRGRAPGVNEQYSLRIRSDVGVVVQYGRLDVQQPNMAYLATLGYPD
jgi:hypothetical protein